MIGHALTAAKEIPVLLPFIQLMFITIPIAMTQQILLSAGLEATAQSKRVQLGSDGNQNILFAIIHQ